MSLLTVSIVQRRLTHYRVPLFEALRRSLADADITLRVLHGEGNPREMEKNDSGHLGWSESLDTKYLAGNRLCWQPFARQVSGSALVIVTQENAMLANHLALVQRPAPRLAFWGHGANLQGNSSSLRETYKRWSTRQVDWYFAYTGLSVDTVERSGFPRDRITQLNNAIDLRELQDDLAAAEGTNLRKFRASLGLGEGPVGLFLGSLYTHKRLDFLLSAAEKVRGKVDGFQLLIVGDGPQRDLVERASFQYPWIRYTGALKGIDKAKALNLATISMNPGLVGLGILDSFAAGVPMITTDCGLHSPEIAYLSPENGVITPDDLDSYVDACTRVLTDKPELDRLACGCRAAVEVYTLPNMVENFSKGVIKALEVAR